MFSFAQERVSGKVIDDNGKPIAMANVMLYPDSLAKQSILTYAVTDNKGIFRRTRQTLWSRPCRC